VSEFFAMGGYGKYVWSSYCIGLGVVLLNLVLARLSLANAKRLARRRMEMSK
jgi:heme exporter protein CcmD